MSSTSRMVRLMRCSVAERKRRAGQRDVDALGGERGVRARRSRSSRLALLDQPLELDAHDVAQLADHRALLGAAASRSSAGSR